LGKECGASSRGWLATGETTLNDIDIADQRVAAVIEAIASGNVAPGAGSAGALALALATACTRKAVNITLRHDPHDEALARAGERLECIGAAALAGAEEDASRFAEFVREKDAPTATALVRAGERLDRLGIVLAALLDEVEPRVATAVAGDVKAARALCDAFATIQHQNLVENRQAAGSA